MIRDKLSLRNFRPTCFVAQHPATEGRSGTACLSPLVQDSLVCSMRCSLRQRQPCCRCALRATGSPMSLPCRTRNSAGFGPPGRSARWGRRPTRRRPSRVYHRCSIVHRSFSRKLRNNSPAFSDDLHVRIRLQLQPLPAHDLGGAKKKGAGKCGSRLNASETRCAFSRSNESDDSNSRGRNRCSHNSGARSSRDVASDARPWSSPGFPVSLLASRDLLPVEDGGGACAGPSLLRRGPFISYHIILCYITL